MIKNALGISMIEVILTLGIMSVVSVASVWLVFTTIALRDQVRATTTTSEGLRVFYHDLYESVLSASIVSGNSNSLLLTSPGQCWSFVYDPAVSNIRYSHIQASGCTPNPSPSTLFFPSYTQVTSFSFTITSLSTGGRQVTAAGIVNTVFPFASYQTSFSDTFTNVID